MKKLIIVLLVIVLVVLVGTWPLSIVAKLFEWVAYGLRWLANLLNFFGWNGLL